MTEKQQQSSDSAAPLQPLVDIAMFNFTATQKITELQSTFVSYLLDLNLKQCKALSTAKDPQEALKLQFELIKEADAKWCDLAEQEIEAARGLQSSINGVLEKNICIPEILEQFTSVVPKQILEQFSSGASKH